MENLTQAEKGAADDIAAKQVGLSRPTAIKGAKVVAAIDKLIAEGKQDEAEELRQILNGQSFNAAIQAAVEAGHVEKPPPKKPTIAPKPPADEKEGGKPPVGPGKTATGEGSRNDTDMAGGNSTPPGTHEETEPSSQTAAGSSLPPIVVLTEAINRFVDAHKDFDVGDASNNEKWNFNRAFEGLSDWRENHAEMLRLPGQPSE